MPGNGDRLGALFRDCVPFTTGGAFARPLAGDVAALLAGEGFFEGGDCLLSFGGRGLYVSRAILRLLGSAGHLLHFRLPTSNRVRQGAQYFLRPYRATYICGQLIRARSAPLGLILYGGLAGACHVRKP